MGKVYRTLGSVAVKRGLEIKKLDPYDHETVAQIFNIPHSLACEIMWKNDDNFRRETPEERYTRVRKWVESAIKP